MMNPKFLSENAQIAKSLSEYFENPDLPSVLGRSHDELQEFCKNWNSVSDRTRNRIRLKTYNIIQTISMIIIDPETPKAEVLFELHLPDSIEMRPRFNVIQFGGEDSIFQRFEETYIKLWNVSAFSVE